MADSPTSLRSANSSEPTDIILLAFNRPAHLVRMVEAIEQRTRHPFRLTIVDNGSEADLRAWLHAERKRFHQVVFNQRNLHLAGLQVGIERTESGRYVVSDADLVPPDLGPDRCWLGELHTLLDRHEDFGMIGCRIEGLPMPAWHRLGAPETRVVDNELIEGPTGVWLNMIRRDALRVPFESDGMTCYALGRAGYRVGVGVELLCEHLGDRDPEQYPDYLARKNAANSFRSVYVEYPELARVPRPPLLEECSLSAPVLADVAASGIPFDHLLELGRSSSQPILAAVESTVLDVALGNGPPVHWSHVQDDDTAPFPDGSVDTVFVSLQSGPDDPLIHEAARVASRALLIYSADASFVPPEGFELVEHRPPNDVIVRMARWADQARSMRRLVGYTTLERKHEWLELFAAARFGGRSLRLYECMRRVAREARTPASEAMRCSRCMASPCSCGRLRTRQGRRPYRRPFGRTLVGAIGARAKQLTRAATVLARTRRGA